MALVALGCRVSRADLDATAAALRPRFDLARDGQRADLVVVNTCAITAGAEAAARRAIRRAAREHPGARIVAAGCQAELDPGTLARLPGVASVIGARSGGGVAGVVAGLLGGGVAGAAAGAVAGGAPARHTRPFLKVQDGCDRRCAYCVVPRARGPSRSLPLDDALRALARLGGRHAEVVLAGIHLGAYGRDLVPRASLAALVREAARRRFVHRIRLSSVEAGELPRALLRDPDAAAVLCPHFHLPLQSGSERVLRDMRRPGGARAFRRAVEEIARLVPGACVGTDVLAGFPGETDADHRETVALVGALPLAYLHVFRFSPRPGTAAARMPGAVPRPVARERARELLAISDRRWRAYLSSQVGRELEVVVERVEGGFARGTAGTWVTARWPASGERRGELARVSIRDVSGEHCLGVPAQAAAPRPP